MEKSEELLDDRAVMGTNRFEDVDITDDFMFSYVMRQQEICIELLEYLFPGQKIKTVKYFLSNSEETPTEEVNLDTQKTLTEIFGKRGVRLDVYLDDGKTVYNVEMQTVQQSFLPKRARYYQAQIDINLLERGENYDQLKPSYVIFICKFDPFHKGKYRYTFQNQCEEVEGLPLNDETYKVFFSTVGGEGEISDNLRELLRYMNNTKDYPVEETDVDLIRRIEDAVGIAKKDDVWRRAYMTYQIHQRDAELRGIAAGRAEGRAEGMAKGRAEGRAEGEERKAKETAKSFYAMGFSIEDIAKGIGFTVDTVKNWLGLAPA